MVLNQKTKGGLLQWRYGIDLMEMTMDSQSISAHFIVDFLCNQLKHLGKNINIHRLKQTVPSLEQAKFLSLDQPSQHSCSILMKLGKKRRRGNL